MFFFQKKSFTVLEILITIIIITFSTGISAPFLINYLEDKKTMVLADEIISMLETSKKKSISVDINNNLCISKGKKISGFGLEFIQNEIKQCMFCEDNLNNCLTLKKSDIDNKFQITTTNDIKRVIFLVLTGAVNNDFSITVKNKINNRCISVTINSLGLIEKNELISC